MPVLETMPPPPPQESVNKVYDIPVDDIFADEAFNCRGRIIPRDVADLANGIERDGLLQPIVVQPWEFEPGKRYRIVAGHRRYMAYIIKGWKTIPSLINHNLTKIEARKLNLIENLKREDLNKLQEAKSLQDFFDAGWTEDEIAGELGMSRGWVQIRKIILGLSSDVQAEIGAGFLTDNQIRQLKSLKSLNAQHEAVKKIKTAKLSGESITKMVLAKKKPKNPLRNSVRTPPEIFKLQETIMDTIGANFGTRLLGWAAGTVNDFEIYKDLREAAKEMGINWEIPKEILEALNL